MNPFETPNLAYSDLVSNILQTKTTAYSNRQPDEQECWSDLAFAVSHDMSTPIRHINSYVNLLKEEIGHESSSDNTALLLHRISESLISLKSHQNAMFSYFQAASREVMVEEIALDELVKDCIVKAQDKNKLNVSALLERVRIFSDSDIVKEILNELILNAGKFSKAGETPQINIDLFQEGENVRIDIEDKGIGFSMKYAYRLFSLFKTLHSAVDHEGVGVGSGLAVASRLSGRIGAKLFACSEVGQGAKFSLLIPIYMDSSLL